LTNPFYITGAVKYTALPLRERGMLPSLSRPSNPCDNATCESFLKTLKREEIHASTYRDFEDLRERMEEFIERY
jgi:putative transposase